MDRPVVAVVGEVQESEAWMNGMVAAGDVKHTHTHTHLPWRWSVLGVEVAVFVRWRRRRWLRWWWRGGGQMCSANTATTCFRYVSDASGRCTDRCRGASPGAALSASPALSAGTATNASTVTSPCANPRVTANVSRLAAR